MTKRLTEIPNELVVEALQIVSNYCRQNSTECKDCYLNMNDTTCLFFGELPKRFEDWKREQKNKTE